MLSYHFCMSSNNRIGAGSLLPLSTRVLLILRPCYHRGCLWVQRVLPWRPSPLVPRSPPRPCPAAARVHWFVLMTRAYHLRLQPKGKDMRCAHDAASFARGELRERYEVNKCETRMSTQVIPSRVYCTVIYVQVYEIHIFSPAFAESLLALYRHRRRALYLTKPVRLCL